MAPHRCSALVRPIAHSTYPECQNDLHLGDCKRLVSPNGSPFFFKSFGGRFSLSFVSNAWINLALLGLKSKTTLAKQKYPQMRTAELENQNRLADQEKAG